MTLYKWNEQIYKSNKYRYTNKTNTVIQIEETSTHKSKQKLKSIKYRSTW